MLLKKKLGVKLRHINYNEDKEIYDMLQGIERNENDFTNEVKDMPFENFSEWCKLQCEYANGKQLPEGHVSQSIYWLYVSDKPVGVGKIRWKLTESSREAGGNIGYAISKKYRNQGLGTLLLNLLIEKARESNCEEILATVIKSNFASKAVMEKCDGKLIRETNKRWYYKF